MIKINLLPIEKRKAERTPLPRFFLIAATAAAAAILLLYNAWILIRIKNVSDDIAVKEKRLASLQPAVAKFQALTARHTALQTKVREIQGLVSREVDYWRAVNALWDVIHDNPKVWIDDIRVLDVRATQTEMKRLKPDETVVPPYSVSMKCHVAGEEVSEMTQFRNALKDHPVLQETLSTLNFNVDWRVEEEKTFEEKASISFAVTLFGPTSPPVRKKPSGTTPVKAPPPAEPAPAPQGGIR